MKQIIWISIKNSLSALNEAFDLRQKIFQSFALKIFNEGNMAMDHQEGTNYAN